MAVMNGPANAEKEHLGDVEREDPVDVAPSALAGEDEIRRELQEALDYRRAISEILRVISGSAFDLTSVLLTVLTNAKTLCRADMAVLFRYQDGAYRFAVGDGLLPAYERPNGGRPSSRGRARSSVGRRWSGARCRSPTRGAIRHMPKRMMRGSERSAA